VCDVLHDDLDRFRCSRSDEQPHDEPAAVFVLQVVSTDSGVAGVRPRSINNRRSSAESNTAARKIHRSQFIERAIAEQGDQRVIDLFESAISSRTGRCRTGCA